MRLSPLIILLSTHAFAQVSSQLGRFEVAFDRGCAPLDITIVEKDDFGSIPRQYIFEPGLDETNLTTHRFEQPGTFEIVQIVGVDVDPKTDTLIVTVLESRPSEFEIFKCQENGVRLSIDDTYYDDYLIAYEGLPPILFGGNTENLQHTFNTLGINTVAVEGVFEDSEQNCETVEQSVEIGVFENDAAIDEVNFSKACLNLLDAEVLWRGEDQQLYEVEYSLNGIDYTEAFMGSAVDTINIQNISFSNADEICFRVNAISSCDSSRLVGSDFCLDISTFSGSSITNAYASYINNDILLAFDEVGQGIFQGEKVVEGFRPEPLDTLFPNYIDGEVSPIRRYEYSLSFSDVCMNQSDTLVLAPPFIDIEPVGVNEYNVSWIGPTNNLGGDFESSLILKNQENSDSLVVDDPSQNLSLFLTEALGRNQFLSVRNHYGDLNLELISNTIPLNYEFKAFIPDAFTPNGDGLNDRLPILGIVNSEVDFRIFNRWGEVIHQVISLDDPWDGTINGEKAPAGKYFYNLSFINIEGETINQQGTFILIRN